MPYVKSISIHSTPKKTIAYIVNPDKTDNLLYVSGLDLLVSNAMNASDYVVIPVESGVYAYDGLEKMIDKVSSINNSTNRYLRILGILLNKRQRSVREKRLL